MNSQSLTLDELLGIYHEPSLRILDHARAQFQAPSALPALAEYGILGMDGSAGSSQDQGVSRESGPEGLREIECRGIPWLGESRVQEALSENHLGEHLLALLEVIRRLIEACAVTWKRRLLGWSGLSIYARSMASELIS